MQGCVGGILRAMCRGGKSNFADEAIHIRGEDSRIHHGAIGADSRDWEGAESGERERVPRIGSSGQTR
jgi:hypothetical protein